jgi:predicted small lipoprotein YifL
MVTNKVLESSHVTEAQMQADALQPGRKFQRSEEKRMKHNRLLSVVLVLAFALAACGPTQPTSAPPTAAPTFPTGKFIKSGTTNYGLVFNSDGTFSVFDGDNIAVHGTYKAEGNVYTETSNDGGCETDVSFTYTFDGTNLTFNYVGNPDDDTGCSGRYNDFNGVTYTLSE